jgi:hypothetical protein
LPAATELADDTTGLTWRMHPSKLAVVRAVGRRLVPYLIEATVIPTIVFYVFTVTLGIWWGFVAGLGWSYACVARRILRGRAIPGLLLLACLGITVRTAIYLWSTNSVVYFLQPILRTVLTAGTFALSVWVGRPLIERFAADFCPLTPDIQERPAIAGLFRRLTYLWALVNVALAAVSLALLWSVPTTVFVGTTTVATWVITCTGVVLTCSDAVRTARSEGLATAVASNGLLRAYAAASPG